MSTVGTRVALTFIFPSWSLGIQAGKKRPPPIELDFKAKPGVFIPVRRDKGAYFYLELELGLWIPSLGLVRDRQDASLADVCPEAQGWLTGFHSWAYRSGVRSKPENVRLPGLLVWSQPKMGL